MPNALQHNIPMGEAPGVLYQEMLERQLHDLALVIAQRRELMDPYPPDPLRPEGNWGPEGLLEGQPLTEMIQQTALAIVETIRTAKALNEW